MKFSFSLFLALAAPTAALRPNKALNEKLLAKARFLDGEVDFTWVTKYSMKFDACHTLIQIADEQGENGSLIYNKNLVTFHLCPTDTCETSTKTGCGKYVVGMEEFVDMYTEAMLEEQEWICENLRENCYCNNADDEESCQNTCYTNAGHEECVEIEGQDAFEIQEYLECREIENQNGNNNGNYKYEADGAYYYQAFVGPYCSSNGKSIHLGVFYDEFCSIRGSDSIYASMNYNQALLYSAETGTSIVEHNCVSCKEVDRDANDNNNNNNNNNNGNDQEDEDEVVQMCEELYEFAGRCESSVEPQSQYQYIDNTGCEYINTILPKLEQNSKSVSSKSSSGGTASVVFAWLFAFTTLALGVYAFLLFRKLRRSKVNLSEQTDGEMS